MQVVRVLAVAALALAVCGCGKWSAEYTAKFIKANTTYKSVRCTAHGHEPGWDYVCTLTPGQGGADHIDVKVNGSGIVDQSAP